MYSAQVSPSHPHHHQNPNSYYDVFNSSIMLQDDDGVVLSYLLSQQLDTDSSKSADVSIKDSSKSKQGEVMMEEERKKKKKKKGQSSSKRKRSSGKKDRHSKICTASGPRDRRMRLSVPIARKFFDLQDVLGFDRASETIEWLFTKAKSAIEELKKHLDLSPTCRTTCNESNEVVVSRKMKGSIMNTDVKKTMMRSRVAKRSRDEARERARERTRVKQQRIRSSDEANPKDLGFSFMDQEAKNCNGDDEHDSIIGRSSSSIGCGFPSFNGNWGNKMTPNLTDSSIMGLTSKYEEHTTSGLSYFSSSNSQEHKYCGTYSNPCSINFLPNQLLDYSNPNSNFIATFISPDQNLGQFLNLNQEA